MSSLEMTNGPGAQAAKHSTGTANPTATNEKGNHMSTTKSNRDFLCAPWCDHALRGREPEEHSSNCISRCLGRADAVDGDAILRKLSTDVILERDLPTARSRVRLFMMPVYNDGEPFAVAVTPADARSIAAALLAAADIADGLAPIPSSWYAQRLHLTAAALADKADTAFEADNDELSEALDSAAAELRIQAARAEA